MCVDFNQCAKTTCVLESINEKTTMLTTMAKMLPVEASLLDKTSQLIHGGVLLEFGEMLSMGLDMNQVQMSVLL